LWGHHAVFARTVKPISFGAEKRILFRIDPSPLKMRSMARFLRKIAPLIFFCVSALGAAPEAPPQGGAAAPAAGDHEREELGVNPYTAPSIPMLLEELAALRPIPYPTVRRPIPSRPPTNRALLALNFGALVADGFLVAVSERPDDADTIGRMLIKVARGMGVAPVVTRHARSLGERAARKDWSEVRKELVAMQEDVERGLMELRDEEIAHLIALGGWIRGLQIYSRIAEGGYEPNRAAQLLQPDLVDYFLDRLRTLSPGTKEASWVAPTVSSLKAIRAIIRKPEGETLQKEEVARVQREITAAMDAILATEAAMDALPEQTE
jgi:hypothetical protein